MKIKIGINALFMIPNKVGGTEYHLRSFLKFLEQTAASEEFVVFCNKENFDTLNFSKKNWQKVLCPVQARNRIERILYEQLLLPQLAKKMGCSVLHSFGYFGPIWGDFKKVITVHDTNWKDCPEDTPYLQNLVLHVLISQSITHSDVVITDSDFSLQRLQKYFPKFRDKMRIIYPGLEEDFSDGLRKPSSSLLANKKYILCVSAFYPHKKILYLLDLWATVQKKQPDLQLVLVGSNGTDAPSVINRVRTEHSIKWFAKVSYTDLITLYQHASACIFPSIYEGFGYPAYEALAAGLPTLVGKKQLYHPRLQSALNELTFNLEEDLTLVENSLRQKKNTPNLKFLSYKTAVEKLLLVYRSLR